MNFRELRSTLIYGPAGLPHWDDAAPNIAANSGCTVPVQRPPRVLPRASPLNDGPAGLPHRDDAATNIAANSGYTVPVQRPPRMSSRASPLNDGPAGLPHRDDAATIFAANSGCTVPVQRRRAHSRRIMARRAIRIGTMRLLTSPRMSPRASPLNDGPAGLPHRDDAATISPLKLMDATQWAIAHFLTETREGFYRLFCLI